MDKTTVNWAVAAPGNIAAKFAEALSALSKKDTAICCYAVGSREIDKANAFAKQWGFSKAYGSYEELFADPAVDVVYIANPHPYHAPLALQALTAGKHVVVEKPAAMNAPLLQQLIDFAHDKNLFFLEAYWTAFNPTALEALDDIRAGKIGTVIHADINFCMKKAYDPQSRLFNPELGGGALLDVGIYPLTFAMMVSHAADDMAKGRTKRSVLDSTSVNEPRRIVSNARISKGVDCFNSTELTFANGMTAVLKSAVDMEPADNPKDAYIYGTKGYIRIPLFWMCQQAELFAYKDAEGADAVSVEKINHPFDVNGYEYEIVEATKCILSGRIATLLHSPADALAVCKVMDILRSQWHLVYPCETAGNSGNAITDASGNKITGAAGTSSANTSGNGMTGSTTSNSVSGGSAAGASSDTITVYTDGGCHGNPGPGGWGCVILDGQKETTLSGGEPSTTNNKMELMAAISALAAVAQNKSWKTKKIVVYSDSQYVKNGITTWIKSWKQNGWKTSNKKPVLNQDLWEELDELYSALNVQWSWVKGHAGVKYNELCDQLCQQEIRSQMGGM